MILIMSFEVNGVFPMELLLEVAGEGITSRSDFLAVLAVAL